MPSSSLLLLLAMMMTALLPDPTPPGRVSLVVHKAQRRLDLCRGDSVTRSFRVGLGWNPVSPKLREGDGATPEGVYRICAKMPHSRFHLALLLNYPNAEDAERGMRDGLITRAAGAAIIRAVRDGRCPDFRTTLGGEIEIHGSGSGSDWTLGCIALEDVDIEDVYRAVRVGTEVRIRP